MDALSASSPVQRVAFMKGAQIGAPLHVDTPIPTLSGWTDMGRIKAGDVVFDERGRPTEVTGVSEIFTDRRCWAVVFSDGSEVVCDDGHLWTVDDEKSRKKRTLTTGEIAATFKVRGFRNRYAIDVAAPLDLPDADLPIPPYTLGAWLGDGSAHKHIPPVYLRASRAQRLSLLRGLMDTDGSVTTKGGRCEISFADRALVDGTYELLQTLGIKAKIRERVSSKIYWRIDFAAYADEAIFGLKTKRRRIVDVRPTESVPVRCISVDTPSHLFLCGRSMIPTHNTESGLNWIGYVVHQAPGPMLSVQPTVDMAKRYSKQRIAPMIEESDSLRGLVNDPRERDSGNTVLAKEFPGGVLVMTGANSAVGLRSMPARYVFLDEVDGYPGDVDGEGDPVALAEARTRTFQRRKVYMVSTPTISGRSRIEREFSKSDQRRFFLPCPECGHFQTLKFSSLKWDKGDPASAMYVCEECGCLLGERHKTEMLRRGEWRATAPGDGRTVGFHLSSLYSPVGWMSWVEIAQRWEAAQGDPDLLKEFVNTVLGETWQQRGDAPEWDHVYQQRGGYTSGSVPAGALVLFAGVDVQKDRLEVGVWGFGRNRQRWLIEHRVLPGPTNRPEVWSDLEAMFSETWLHESGTEVAVREWGIDSGAFAPEVGAFVRNQQGRGNVHAVDGQDRYDAAFIGIGALDLTVKGKKLRRGLKTLKIGVSYCKQEIVSQLALVRTEDGTFPPGFVHLPSDVSEDQVKQLTSESLVTKRVKGRIKREWQVIEGRRNEVLDCFDGETEVLTSIGWRRFYDLSGKEQLATVNLDSDEIEFQTPVGLIRRHHSGEMLSIQSKRLSIMVTPNHRMVTYKKVFDRSIKKWRFDVPPQITLARDLTIHHQLKLTGTWVGRGGQTVTIPASVSGQGREISPSVKVDAGDMAEFIGWFVAEGCRSAPVSKTQGNKRYRVELFQNEGAKLDRIEALLARLPFKWHRYERGEKGVTLLCLSKQLYEFVGACGDGVENKRVPQWVKDASPEIISRCLEGAILGDGWIQGNFRTVSTISRRLADDYQELFIKTGCASNVKEVAPKPWKIGGRSGYDTRPQYWVTECRVKKASLDGGGNGKREFLGKFVPFDGEVFCATVPNGTLICRREGRSFVAGNCANYARGVAAMRGWDRWRDARFAELEAFFRVDEVVAADGQIVATPQVRTQRPVRQVRRSNWMS